jgi:hypothetical protein
VAKERATDEFERLVEAALKVDPKGLSGKHKGKRPAKAPKKRKER